MVLALALVHHLVFKRERKFDYIVEALAAFVEKYLYVPERYPAFWKDWNKRRIKKRVESYNLIRHEKRGAFSEKEFKNFKFLPKEFSGNPTVTVIYGNKVVQQLFSGKMFFFVITSRELAENYKRYHRFLWDKVAKP